MDHELTLIFEYTLEIGLLMASAWLIIGCVKRRRKYLSQKIANKGCCICKYYLRSDDTDCCTYGITVKIDPLTRLPYRCGFLGASRATRIFPECRHRRRHIGFNNNLRLPFSTSSPQALFGDCGPEGKFFEAK